MYRDCLQEVLVTLVVVLLRAICSRYYDREGRAVMAAGTLGDYRLRRGVVFGTHEDLNLFARLGTLNP